MEVFRICNLRGTPGAALLWNNLARRSFKRRTVPLFRYWDKLQRVRLDNFRARPTLKCMSGVLLENLSKVFAGPGKELVTALKGVNLEIRPGELFVLLGPSGSGKTTLLRIIAGLESASSGSVTLGGTPADDLRPQDRGIAMVFQEHTLYPHLSIRNNLSLGLKLRKIPCPEIDKRVREAGEQLGLTSLLLRAPRELSGGERQRVALGRAIVQRPQLLLLDEPLSNLDARLRAKLRREIALLQQKLRLTTIHVTHDQNEAMALAERLAVIKDGVVQQVGTPWELYHEPANLFVAGFLGLPPMNFFPGQLIRKKDRIWFCCEVGEQTGLPAFALGNGAEVRLEEFCGKKVALGLRPEHLVPMNSKPATAASTPSLEATVQVCEHLGPESHIYFSTAGGSTMVARCYGPAPAATGTQLWIALQINHAHVFDVTNGQSLYHSAPHAIPE
jgi:multiple sugar transport system ATP-binding protein